MKFDAVLAVAFVLVCVLSGRAKAFGAGAKALPARPASASTGLARSPTAKRRRSFFGRALASSSVATAETTASESSDASAISRGSAKVTSNPPPSWDELSKLLEDLTADEETPKSAVTLYRDTNGWCPFCERVWVVLRAKGIPYDEQLVSLQNKPDWYKALVPTTLVPAVLFHGDDESNERRIVWESGDIMRALDDEFPGTPKMMHETSEFEAAVQMNEDLQSAGFAFVYGGRNDTLTEQDKLDRRNRFISELDRLEMVMKGQNGPFRLGKEFTGVDALMIPTLERWRYQLPITADIDILEGRPALVKWFEAMDSFAPYSDRVAGDEYSWTATNSMFLRYFGGGEDKPQVASAIKRADAAAERLAGAFVQNVAKDEEGKYAREAAAKLISNYEAVVKDCTRSEPKSQQHIGRASDSDAADIMLRYVASVLLSCGSPSGNDVDAVEQAKEVPMLEMAKESAEDAATAARTVASRLCVPRDMSAPAASIFRGVLAAVSDRLD